MPVTDAYTDAATYRGRINMTDSTKDAAILADLVAISRYIDRKCDRFFTKDAAAVARVFYPRGYHGGDPEAENPWRGIRGARLLDVDDMADVPTSIIIDLNRTGSFAGYTPLATTDYQLWPLNAEKGPEPKPWNQIYIPSWSTQFGWPPGCPVQVTVPWGWPNIPGSVARATEQIAAMLRIEGVRATMHIPEGIEKEVDASPAASAIVAELVKSYKRERLWA